MSQEKTTNESFNPLGDLSNHLSRIESTLVNAEHGNRYTNLNKASYYLGGLVPNEVSYEDAIAILTNLVKKNCVFSEDPENWLAVITKGLDDGMKKPLGDKKYHFELSELPKPPEYRDGERVFHFAVNPYNSDKKQIPKPDDFHSVVGSKLELIEYIKKGFSFVGSEFFKFDEILNETYKSTDCWLGSELIVIDIDKTDKTVDQIMKQAKQYPLLFAYTTYSHKPDNPRMRLIFFLDRLNRDLEFHKKITKAFQEKFSSDNHDNPIQAYFGNTKAEIFDGVDLKTHKGFSIDELWAMVNPEVVQPDYFPTFWKKSGSKAKIVQYDFFKYLNYRHDVYRMLHDGKWIFIKNHDGMIQQINAERIMDLVATDVGLQLIPKDIYDKILDKGLHVESKQRLLDELQYRKHKDTRDKSYFYFRNGFIEITASAISLRSYSQLKANIWNNQLSDYQRNSHRRKHSDVIDFEISIVPPDEDISSEYGDFIHTVAHNEKGLRSAIGYLLHRYKNRSGAKAIVFMDTNNPTSNKDGEGGTGKSLIAIQSINKMRRVHAESDGTFIVKNNKFAFQGISGDTDLFVLDECAQNFTLHNFYNMITGDLAIERKNRDRKTLSFEDVPKTAFITNYTINDKSPSGQRRIEQYVLRNVFNENFRPVNEYGREFFSQEWDNTDWNDFYNFMFRCVQLYLSKGLIPESKAAINDKKRGVKRDNDLHTFMELIVAGDADNMIEISKEHFKISDMAVLYNYLLDTKYTSTSFRKLIDKFGIEYSDEFVVADMSSKHNNQLFYYIAAK